MPSSAVAYMQADPSYRKDPGHAQSHVKYILKSPAHYIAAKQRKFAPTIAMQIGSALHCLVLEGKEQFESDYVLKPEGLSLTTKEGKEWKAQNGKKTALSKTDQYASWDAVHGMAESLHALEWFDPSQTDYRKYNEVSLYWDADDINCKCRLDRVVFNENSAVVLDLKTTDSIDEKDFLKKVTGSMNYLFQSAWYVEGVEAVFHMPASFIFIAIERTPPYATAIFEISSDMIAEGLRQTAFARQRLSHCLKTKDWGKPKVERHVLELPPWYQSPISGATLGEIDRSLDDAFSVD